MSRVSASFLRFAPTVRLVAVLALVAGSAVAAPVRVAVVSDGPAGRDLFAVETIAREVANVVDAGDGITFPADKRFTGDWSMAGVQAALDRALADRNVDVVLAMGMLGSQAAANRAALAKPVIAATVSDPVLQGYPLSMGASGRKNFTYVADFQSVENDLTTFSQVVGFKHLTAFVDAALMEALPELARKADQMSAALSAAITIVRVDSNAAAALAALPPDTDAVYVTGLTRFATSEFAALTSGLATRKLPSFSLLGRSEVEQGLLMTLGGAQPDAERFGRRIVLMIARIAQGENPATFEVSLPSEQRLIINMRTAEAIGFSPRWQYLTDAEQIATAPTEPEPPLTLLAAMRAAIDRNPSLAASHARLESSADDVTIARSNLLPQLDLAAGRTRIDADRASPLTQAENTTTAGIQGQQVLFSERARAGYAISKSLYVAAQQGDRQQLLDTLEDAAAAYLNLLRAQSLEVVRHGNVENTRRNLETARVRETVGLGGHSDYLRWVAQLARDKQESLAAESTRRQAEAEVARVLHRPATERFATVESGLDDPLALVASPRVQGFLDTPAKWGVFMDYVVNAALTQAPEIAQAAAVVGANRRSVTAARRSYFVPEISLATQAQRVAGKSGAGSVATPGAPDSDSWSVALQATIPLFAGRRRAADLSQARHELQAAEADSAAVTDAIEARARVVLHRTASSYPSIDLSREAAAAANQNLAMVTDAYARGAVNVTDLIDAQDTALSAGLGAANAKYTFLADFVGVLRAMSEFDILLDPQSREAWFARVDAWIATHPETSYSAQ